MKSSKRLSKSRCFVFLWCTFNMSDHMIDGCVDVVVLSGVLSIGYELLRGENDKVFGLCISMVDPN